MGRNSGPEAQAHAHRQGGEHGGRGHDVPAKYQRWVCRRHGEGAAGRKPLLSGSHSAPLRHARASSSAPAAPSPRITLATGRQSQAATIAADFHSRRRTHGAHGATAFDLSGKNSPGDRRIARPGAADGAGPGRGGRAHHAQLAQGRRSGAATAQLQAAGINALDRRRLRARTTSSAWPARPCSAWATWTFW